VSEGRSTRSRVRIPLAVLAGCYLVTLWLSGVGCSAPARNLPRPWMFFTEIAALFPNAPHAVLEYRAEGWSCAERRWVEVDVRPWFPMFADVKENRFHRVLNFHRKNPRVLRALDDFLVQKNNASGREEIGGVRLIDIRVPFPKPGEPISRYSREPLGAFPSLSRRAFYTTSEPKRLARCGLSPKPRVEAEDEETSPTSSEEGEP
jgi:hypothetical protein